MTRAEKRRVKRSVDSAILAGLQGILQGTRFGCIFVVCKCCCMKPAPALDPTCLECKRKQKEAASKRVIRRVLATIRRM